MGPLVDGAWRATVLCDEGEHGVGIIYRRTGNPSQTVLWRELIHIKVSVKVNAAQTHIADLELGIAERRNFSCQVPLPAIRKVRGQLHALGSRSPRRAKVVHIYALCKCGAV